MDRFFIRKKREKCESKKLNIAVTGLGRCVGTTLIASSLAFFFCENGNSVTFVQCADPAASNGLIFDSAAMDKRFYGREFTDFYRKIADGENIRNRSNLEMGINWVLVTPQNAEDRLRLTQAQKTRLISAAEDEINIFDLEPGEGYEEFLVDMDAIIVAVDPLPSRMTSSLDSFRKLKSLEISGNYKFSWLVSGVNGGISKRQVKGFLKSNNILWADKIQQEILYANEYRCCFHWENDGVKTAFSDVFTKLSHYIIN